MLNLAMYGRLYETNIKLLLEKRKLEDAAGKSPARDKKEDEEKTLVNQTDKSAQQSKIQAVRNAQRLLLFLP